ncbi:MAG: hypothetical protein KDB04_08390 [Acidimicrobiales bacterium]|nr:hypothetical protein [Acidimicrobiales bacterium]HRW37894.1 hypothetical protein [Aquihabitans sp.]
MSHDYTLLPVERRSLIGVYEDQAAADAAVAALRARTGHDDDVVVGPEAHPIDSLLAEMQQESNDAVVAPHVGIIYPKESLRSSALLGPPLIAIFTILFLPLGFIPMGDVDLWIRLLGAAVVGAACGGAILLIVGPAMGVKRTSEPLAAERGITIRLDRWSPEAEEALIVDGLLRLDVVDREERASGWMVAAQDTSKGANVVGEMVRNAEPADNDDVAGATPAPDRTPHRQG